MVYDYIIPGGDAGSETHFARAFGWRNYEYSKKLFEFSNKEVGLLAFQKSVKDIAERHWKDVVIPGMEPTGHDWFALGKIYFVYPDTAIFVLDIEKYP